MKLGASRHELPFLFYKVVYILDFLKPKKLNKIGEKNQVI